MNRSDRPTGRSAVTDAGGVMADVPVTLAAFGAAATDGVATVQERSLGARAGRAALALGAAWILAVPAVFLPVAHFALVPGLLVGGVVLAAMRLAETRTLARVRGVCPRCHAQLDVSPGGRFRLPRAVQCVHCRNELTMAVRAAG
jgi:hypothetical protein